MTKSDDTPSTVESARLMTTEEFLALPDDGVERWLIRGQLREKRPNDNNGTSMTVRNQDHSEVMASVTSFLDVWRRTQPPPRGRVGCGEEGIRLQRTPDSTVGVDVAYYTAEVADRRKEGKTTLYGVPVLVVEILSPNDSIEEIEEKIDTYLAAGVALV